MEYWAQLDTVWDKAGRTNPARAAAKNKATRKRPGIKSFLSGITVKTASLFLLGLFPKMVSATIPNNHHKPSLKYQANALKIISPYFEKTEHQGKITRRQISSGFFRTEFL